jgi:D-xylose reductase
MAVSSTKLRVTGHSMPQVGLGLWKIPNESTADAVYSAIVEGYRHFDAACDYGNEKETGQGIQRALKEGIVTREELFITSKLWATFHAP